MPDGVLKLVDLVGLHVEATSGTPLVILREHDVPHRVLPIFIGGAEAASIAVALSGQTLPRPLTHDLMAALVESLDARVTAVEVTALRDGTFLAELALSGPSGERRLDARPSDGIALAVRSGAPLYAADDVLGEAGSVLGGQLDEEAIDRAVAEFRGSLDRLDPAALSEALREQPERSGIDSDEAEPDGNDEAPPQANPGLGDRG
jgi:bifunctional DNase/RNase